jgi:hypothetical protein
VCSRRSAYHNRVSLSCIDVKLVDLEGLVCDTKETKAMRIFSILS